MSTNELIEHDVLKALNTLALGIISITDRSDVFWHVARGVVGEMGFSDCVVYMVDSDCRLLRPIAATGSEKPIDRTIANIQHISFGEGVTGDVAFSGKPCISNNLANDSRYIRDVEPALSEICVPFFVQGEIAGVIDCEDPATGKFGDFHLETLSTVAAILSVKLDLMKKEDLVGRQNITLRRNEERFTLAMNGANDGLWDWNFKTDRVYYSPRWFKMLGRDSSAFPKTLETWAELVNPKDHDRVLELVEECVSGFRDTFETEFSMLHKNGSWVDILSRAFPVREDGETIRLVGTHVDITEQKRTERELRQSEERYKLALQHASIWDYDIGNDTIFVSPHFGEQLGYSEEEFASILAVPLSKIMHPDDVVGFRDKFQLHLETPNTVFIHELRYQTKSGKYKWFLARGQCITSGSAEPVRSTGILTEITDKKRLESSLHQAQKMEAVGQLTGGIAHDFNNLLAVIQGNAELLEEVATDHASMVAAILRASERGAELTQRLLAFSRKQPLSPEAFSMFKLISGMTDLLERTLGETIVIEVPSKRGGWRTLADPGQVENALLNLALNARDAMPTGGKLTIECNEITLDEGGFADIAAGEYVVLSVTDHGLGMTRDIQKHAFEPFFTTKETGKGSGLGLSMVYGFAQQSGGQTTIYSEKGKGTTVKLYLPRARSEVDMPKSTVTEAVPRGQGETILLIEDDFEVRDLAELMLKNLGYTVVSSKDADAARQCIGAHPEITLVLSDVVLPGGISGPEISEEHAVAHPKLKFIFMSGYPAEAAKRNGFLGSDKVLLNKPFRIAQLAKAVHDALKK